jgi:hypothetical protein
VLSMGGVIVLGRPGVFGGALAVPKHRRFDLIVRIERGLHPTTSAMSLLEKHRLRIMSSIWVRWARARFGAILVKYVGDADPWPDSADRNGLGCACAGSEMGARVDDLLGVSPVRYVDCI